jgi:hypothetical protein
MPQSAQNENRHFACPDWSQPVFFGVRDVLPEFTALAVWPQLPFYNQVAQRRMLSRPDGEALTFVSQPKKPSRWRRRLAATSANDRYDQSVLGRGEIPTRLFSWHDFFNNVSWLMYPQAKGALVERLSASYTSRTPADVERAQFRSREGDRLAILDEGGILEATDGTRTQRMVFGHALQESVVFGRTDIRCMRVAVRVQPDDFASPAAIVNAADRALASLLRSGFFSGDPVLPDPVNLRDFLQ